MGILTIITENRNLPLDELTKVISEYESQNPYDYAIATAKAAALFFADQYDAAAKYIDEAITKMPTNADNLLFAANIYLAKKDYANAGIFALKCKALCGIFADKPGMKEYDQSADPIFDLCNNHFGTAPPSDDKYNYFYKICILLSNGAFFPSVFNVYENINKVFLGTYLPYPDDAEYSYFVSFLSQSYFEAISEAKLSEIMKSNVYALYATTATQALRAKTVSNVALTDKDIPCILPIATTEKSQVMNFAVKNNTLHTGFSSSANIFKYYKIDKPVRISSAQAMIVGKPIALGIEKQKKKLILSIFVDALAQKYLTDTKFEDMPFTKRFFDKGTIFTNCFSTAEWTPPSFAALFSGVFTTRHHIYHRSPAFSYPQDRLTLAQIMQKQYFTADIASTIGTNPYIGGYRGFDRSVHMSCIGFMDEQLISEAASHITAFKDTNQFVLLSLFSPHQAIEENVGTDNILGLVEQTAVSFEAALTKQPVGKSVKQKKNTNTILKYRVAVRELDRKLQALYNQIENTYTDDEILVTLFSDHGISVLDDDEFLLKATHTNTCMMMRGGGVASGINKEYINHFDMIPMLAKLGGIEQNFSDYDCVLPQAFGGRGREYTYTECIYPFQPYRAAINTSEYYFTLETLHDTRQDGGIDANGYEMHLYKQGTKDELDEAYKYAEFEQIVFEHIKENMIY